MDVQIVQAGSQKERRAASAPKAPTERKLRTAAEILAERRARASGSQKMAVVNNEETIEAIAVLLADEGNLINQENQLDKARGRAARGSVQAQELASEISKVTETKKQVQEELRYFHKEAPAAYDEAVKRNGFRQDALEHAETIGAHDPSRTDAGTISGLITSATESGFICVATNDEGDFSWGRQAYESAWPNDEAVSSVANALGELIAGFQQAKDDKNAGVIEELRRAGFYISSRREGDTPSEVDLLREETTTARKLSPFLKGTGTTYVQRAGREFIVLERRDGKVFAVKTSGPLSGNALFFHRDRSNGDARVPNNRPNLLEIKGTDVSGVWYDHLRLAMEEELRRETESAERRDAATMLRQAEIADRITAFAVGNGEKGTAVVNARVGEKGVFVTLHLTGHGNGTFSVSQHVAGTTERVDPDKRWMAKAFDKDGQPVALSVEVLKKSRDWRELVQANAESDRDWQLARETERRNAVTVTNENVGDLVNVEGKDGLYAILTRDRRDNKHDPRRHQNEPVREWFVPVGFIVERKGSTVKIDYAVPGPSLNKAEKLAGEHQITELSPMFRAVLRNALYSVHRRENGKLEVPTHLQSPPRQDQAEE